MTEASTGTGSPSRAALPAGPVWRAGLLATAAAVVVNAVVWVLLQQVLDVGLQIPGPAGQHRAERPAAGHGHRGHRRRRPGRGRRCGC